MAPVARALLDLQRTAGNKAVTTLATRRVPVQRANAVVSKSGMVGDIPGPQVNDAADVRLAIERLMHLNSITMPGYDAIAEVLRQHDAEVAALPKAEQAAARKKPVDVASLAPLVAALVRNAEGSINPGVAQWQLGVQIGAPVGPGLDNVPSDVEMLARALQFEGLATNVTADAASHLPAVLEGLADLKNRILTGVRPEGPRLPGGLAAAGSGDYSKVTASLDGADRVPEETVLDWANLLSKTARVAPAETPGSTITKAQICQQIAANRANIPNRPGVGLAFSKPVAPYHQGISYTRSKELLRAGAEPRPASLTEGSDSRTAANNAAWDELLTEGSAGSGNSYDSQLMTVGRGFGVQGGQGAAVLNAFFSADASAKSALLHVGFTVEGTTAVVVDTEHQVVLRGDAALKYITLNKAIYSQLANTAESPAHIDKMSDAQFGVMRDNAAKIPQEVFDGGTYVEPAQKPSKAVPKPGPPRSVTITAPWNVDVMRFAVHLKHAAGGITWNRMITEGTGSDGRGDINKLAGLILPHLPPHSAYGAGQLWGGEENRMLEWGEHLVGKQLSKIAKLPDAATVPAGTRYFAVTGGFKVWSAGVSLASE
ncbi:hypothetical protein GCM10009765_09460 [Fodinicola feengrottensis]|uniref:Uncharacterized protein n=2 Tax=Fodinicola feengrottensis TaxID=435914 RepID=A0ABN2FYG5_9ACTN